MAGPLNPVYTSPRTESQLREILAKLTQSLRTIDIDVNGLEDAILRDVVADAALTARQIVYVTTSGHVNLARADNATTQRAIGIVPADIANGATGSILLLGAVQSTGWGLTPGVTYYLSPTTAGLITATAPSTPGQYILEVGKTLTTDVLVFNPQQSILL